jgi:hypothetical protein
MKKISETKYPNSASLFQFCRKVLDHKFGGVRVIDQDVGQILGFDPADCSHWKKGKKNVRSIQAMKSIADHLGVDERLVIDVAIGELGEDEAFWEYSGYGSFSIDPTLIETARKDFVRKNASTWSRDRELDFRVATEINEAAIDQIVAEIHDKLQFKEAPLYLPELMTSYPDIRFSAKTNESRDEITKPEAYQCTENGGHFIMSYPAELEGRAYTRFRLAKMLAAKFLGPVTTNSAIGVDDSIRIHVSDVRDNLFAGKLLTPASLVRQEMKNLNVSKDIITQLAEVFWVSKSFMNQRLKQILQSSALI